MVNPTCPSKKNFRWTARGRTWSSPPSSARTSSILLDAPFSKVQGWHKNLGGQPPNLPHPLTHPTDNRYLNLPLGLTLSTPSLVKNFKWNILNSNEFSKDTKDHIRICAFCGHLCNCDDKFLFYFFIFNSEKILLNFSKLYFPLWGPNPH